MSQGSWQNFTEELHVLEESEKKYFNFDIW